MTIKNFLLEKDPQHLGTDADTKYGATAQTIVNYRDKTKGGVLNDDSREPLDLASLRLSAEPVPYCRVKGGRVEARLLRKAYYALMRHAEPTTDGACVLRAAGQQVALATAAS